MSVAKLDPFEARLAGQPLRTPPPEWRHEIRAAANRAKPGADESAALAAGLVFIPTTLTPVISHARGALASLYARLYSVLWPSPVAWGGLAAVWLALLAFNTTPSAETLATAKASPVSAEQLEYAFRDQNQLLRELIGPPETAEPKRRPAPATKPRTELRTFYGRA
jgi:hypothetical protein